MTFADKLSKLRREQNYTQEQFADLLGVSRQSVSKWESGIAYPETDKLIKISDMFDCSIDYLLRDTIEEPSPIAVPARKPRKKRRIIAATIATVLVVALLAVAFIPRRATLTITSRSIGENYQATYKEIGSLPYLPSEVWYYRQGTWDPEEEGEWSYPFTVVDYKNIDKYTVGNAVYVELDYDRLYLLDNSGMYRIFIMESYTGNTAQLPAVIVPELSDILDGSVRYIPPSY